MKILKILAPVFLLFLFLICGLGAAALIGEFFRSFNTRPCAVIRSGVVEGGSLRRWKLQI